MRRIRNVGHSILLAKTDVELAYELTKNIEGPTWSRNGSAKQRSVAHAHFRSAVENCRYQATSRPRRRMRMEVQEWHSVILSEAKDRLRGLLLTGSYSTRAFGVAMERIL